MLRAVTCDDILRDGYCIGMASLLHLDMAFDIGNEGHVLMPLRHCDTISSAMLPAEWPNKQIRPFS